MINQAVIGCIVHPVIKFALQKNRETPPLEVVKNFLNKGVISKDYAHALVRFHPEMFVVIER